MSHAEAVLRGGHNNQKLFAALIMSIDEEMMGVAERGKDFSKALVTVNRYAKMLGNFTKEQHDMAIKKVDQIPKYAVAADEKLWKKQVEEFRSTIQKQPIIGLYKDGVRQP